MPEAAARLGSDGKGKDGLVGWLMSAAKKYPEAYLVLLGKLLPMQLATDGGDVTVKYTNKVEIVARLKERGLPIPPSFLPEEPKLVEGRVIEDKAER